MSAQRQQAPNRDLLLQTHQFPCSYMVKAFGPATEAFGDAIRAAASDTLGDRFVSRERRTRSGGSICITLELDVTNVDEVIGVYERLYEVDNLALIM